MYEKAKSSWLKHLDFTIWDIICLEISYLLSFYFRDVWIMRSDVTGRVSVNPFEDPFYRQIAVVLLAIDLMLVVFRQPYKDVLRRGFFQEFKNVIAHNTLILGLMLMYLFAMQEISDLSRVVYVLTWCIGVCVMYVVRIGWKHYVRKRVVQDENLPRLLLVTQGELAKDCIERIKERRYSEFRLIGVVLLDQDKTGEKLEGAPVVANRETMFDYTLANVVDAVLFSENLEEKERELYIYRFLSMGQTVHINLNRISAELPNKLVQQLGSFTVLTTSIKAISVRQALIKRIMDIVGGILGCVITVFAMLPLYPVIKLQAPGPLFFKQTRVGKNGRQFQMYKFRSMYIDAEERKAELMERNEITGQMFKLHDDPRIFPAGKFIRKYSIDELPQFFNILRGDMSLVGTRPPTVDEYENYDLHHKVRLSIKPGLTGLWQVSGRSDIKNFDEVVRLDEKYIENWNIGLDIKILLKTIGVVFGAKGSR